MKTPKARILEAVNLNESPQVSDILRLDDSSLSALQLLVQVVHGRSFTTKSKPTAQGIDILNEEDNLITKVNNTSGQGYIENESLNERLRQLLTAIRIHEIDSYEWINYPPDYRKALIQQRATQVNCTNEEIKRLINLWIA